MVRIIIVTGTSVVGKPTGMLYREVGGMLMDMSEFSGPIEFVREAARRYYPGLTVEER